MSFCIADLPFLYLGATTRSLKLHDVQEQSRVTLCCVRLVLLVFVVSLEDSSAVAFVCMVSPHLRLCSADLSVLLSFVVLAEDVPAMM